MNWIRRQVADLVEGARLIPSLVRQTLSGDSWARIFDQWTVNICRNTGKPIPSGVLRRRRSRGEWDA